MALYITAGGNAANVWPLWKETSENGVAGRITLRFQIKELEAANLTPGEEESLDRELRVLQHSEQLAERASRVYRELYEGEDRGISLLDQLGHLHQVIQEMSSLDEGLTTMSEAWVGPLAELEDLAREVQSYSHKIELIPTIWKL